MLCFTGFKPDIIQIAAKHGDKTFSEYVIPSSGFISNRITDLTGISMRDGNMFSKGERVESSTPESALRDFL